MTGRQRAVVLGLGAVVVVVASLAAAVSLAGDDDDDPVAAPSASTTTTTTTTVPAPPRFSLDGTTLTVRGPTCEGTLDVGGMAPMLSPPVDVDGDGDGEVFVADSTVDRLIAFVVDVEDDCSPVFVRDVEGRPYAFEVGRLEDGGRGIGCVDADGDGTPDLVGLSYEIMCPDQGVGGERRVAPADASHTVHTIDTVHAIDTVHSVYAVHAIETAQLAEH